MKCMRRNKQTFYFARFIDKQDIVDEYGNVTGEHELIYDKPQIAKANISAAKGETSTREFGESESYDKVIVMDKDIYDIDEYTELWVDTSPRLDKDGNATVPHDYIVKKVAESLNSIAIAISKVTVSNE